MILQLNPTIPVKSPKGDGYALFLIDYGTEHDLYWVVALNDNCEIWTYPNHLIRVQKNITMERFGDHVGDICSLGKVSKL